MAWMAEKKLKTKSVADLELEVPSRACEAHSKCDLTAGQNARMQHPGDSFRPAAKLHLPAWAPMTGRARASLRRR